VSLGGGMVLSHLGCERPVLRSFYEGGNEAILIACKPEIATAAFRGLAMTKPALLHLVNEY